MTRLANGRTLKSSTIFLRDENGRARGAFCINYDVSVFLGMQRALAELTRTEIDEQVSETLSDDVNQTIGTIISQTVAEMGLQGPVLNRDDKIDLIARLDEKGVFQVKKAVPILAEQFGFSRATIYNYLRAARDGRLLDRDGSEPDGAHALPTSQETGTD